jgi:hypothetical protein
MSFCQRACVTVCACLLSLTLLPLPARGQSTYDYSLQGGLPTFSTIDRFPGGFVNIANGNVHLEIPLANYPERGKIPSWQKLNYDNKKWLVNNSATPKNWYLNRVGWGVSIPAPFTLTQTFGTAGTRCAYGPITWASPDGANHVFPIEYGGCAGGDANYPNYKAYALDASGYRMNIVCSTVSPGGCTYWIFQSDGTRLATSGTLTLASQQQASTPLEDSNGNLSGSVGREVNTATCNGSCGTYGSYFAERASTYCDPRFSLCGQPSGFTGPYVGTLVYPSSQTSVVEGPNSGASLDDHPLTVSETLYFNVPVNTHFAISGITDYSGNDTNNLYVYRIVLPDGSAYKFGYDCDSSSGLPVCISPSGQTAYYGDLTSITLPTGGGR